MLLDTPQKNPNTFDMVAQLDPDANSNEVAQLALLRELIAPGPWAEDTARGLEVAFAAG